MASSGVNVLRYTALATGIGYGFYHQRSLNAQNRQAKVEREYQHQASLITQAKAEFKKRNMPSDSVTKGGDGEYSFRSVILRLRYFWLKHLGRASDSGSGLYPSQTEEQLGTHASIQRLTQTMNSDIRSK
ncbi:MAG: hypothetical protein L6R39_003049 [Caloplaca ligustica]|nr:MAG: hypothetical protein L6R39_003049 [Caloplaca ligustica]